MTQTYLQLLALTFTSHTHTKCCQTCIKHNTKLDCCAHRTVQRINFLTHKKRQVKLENLVDRTGRNDASCRPPNLTSASYVLDLWTPDTQSWSFHVLSPVCVEIGSVVYKMWSQARQRTDKRRDGRTDKRVTFRHSVRVWRTNGQTEGIVVAYTATLAW